MSQAVDRRAIRRTVRRYVEDAPEPTWSEVTTAVADGLDAEPTDVGRELDALERAGFIYCVETDDGAAREVRLA